MIQYLSSPSKYKLIAIRLLVNIIAGAIIGCCWGMQTGSVYSLVSTESENFRSALKVLD